MSDARDANWDALYTGAHVPAFFARLAEHGFVPANEKQARSYLDIGVSLYAASQQEAARRVDDGDAFLEKLADDLSAQLGGGRRDRDADAWTKEAYDQLTQNPDLVAAARSYLAELG